MTMTITTLLVLICATLALGQRPFFAGSKPIGIPEVTTTEGLADRFGEVDGTTQRLPIEANGDRDLIDRLSKLPIDKQPFWFINWQALEAHRQKPQSFPQKPNQFIDSFQGGQNSSSATFNPNSGIPSGNSNSVAGSSTSTSNSGTPSGNSNSGTPSGNSNSVTSSNSVNNNSNSLPNSNAPEFETSNRFGTEELPKVPAKDQENKVQNSSQSGSGNSNTEKSGGASNDKKQTYFVPKPYYLK